MGRFSFWHGVVVLLVIVLVFSSRKNNDPKASGMNGARYPLFSSVTTTGDEAEYLNDKLPKKISGMEWSLAVLVALAIFTWWLTWA